MTTLDNVRAGTATRTSERSAGIALRGLTKQFEIRKQPLLAIDAVDLDSAAGALVSLIG
jgi:hypothetical protein